MTCPACEGSRLLRILRDGKRTIVRCAGCGLAFLDPFPDAAELAALYSSTYYHQDPRYSDYLHSETARSISPRLPGGRVLDVGVGAGEFLQVASKAGYQAEGIDTSEAAVALCRQAGLTASQADLTTFDAPASSFRCVTMWDVIEHLTRPRDYLRAAHRLLAPGGLLVVKTPNVPWALMTLARVVSRVMTPRSLLGYPAHLLYFESRSLRTILERSGFVVEEARQIGPIRTSAPRRLLGRVRTKAIAATTDAGRAVNLLYYARRP